jgi:hypothetical protein
MLMIGDVFAIVAILIGIFLTSMALVVTSGLLLPEQAQKASRAIAENPRKSVWMGLVLFAAGAIVSVGFLNSPLPLMKVVGGGLALWLLCLMVLGAAGLSHIMARRMQDLDPGLAAYSAFLRSAALLMGGSLLPFVGWMAFAPLMLASSLYGGWLATVPALRTRFARQQA